MPRGDTTVITPSAPQDLVDAPTAMQMLGVKPQTLYAYVSRGLIRAVNPRGNQTSLYYREDLAALQLRSRTRGASRNVAERSLRLGGGAIMASAITAITPQGPRYRGELAIDLAQMGRPFEDTVELLWTGVLPQQSIPWAPPELPPAFDAFALAIAPTAGANNSRRLFSLCTEALASCRGSHAELKAGASVLAARQLLQVLAGACGYLRPQPGFHRLDVEEPLVRAICRSLAVPPRPHWEEVVNAALILSADHELAPSTFAARIAASAGADIHSCASCALGAFEGLYTGLGCDLAEAMLMQAPTPAKYVDALRQIALRKQPLPGYNHSLYPHGDPRAIFLLQLLSRRAPDHRRTQRIVGCVNAAQDKLKALPSLCVALAALSASFELPLRSAGALMALARCAGWVAHTFEQRLAGFLVRPRAEYVGALTPATTLR
jgi:citrate synthase